jgi:hypothetical protein
MRTTLAMMSFGKIALIISVVSLCFQTVIYAKDVNVTLQWDANTEPDLDHYVIYWGINFDPPYGYNSGNIDKSQTTYTVTGLTDGKNYYFTAKAVNTQGYESEYSDIVSIDNPYGAAAEKEAPISGSGAGGGGCFIATAAYGSNMDWHVKILSKFRDRRLVTNPIGRSIVDTYYTLSPPVASYLCNHPFEKAIVRYALIPITGIAYISLFIHPLALLFAFIFMLLTGIYFFKRLAIRSKCSAM